MQTILSFNKKYLKNMLTKYLFLKWIPRINKKKLPKIEIFFVTNFEWIWRLISDTQRMHAICLQQVFSISHKKKTLTCDNPKIAACGYVSGTFFLISLAPDIRSAIEGCALWEFFFIEKISRLTPTINVTLFG